LKGNSIAKKALITFFLLSFVSLFADITYEGARSIIGAYFDILGASALIVGFIGVGELINYIMRSVGGFIAGYFRSSRIYWGLVIAGYFVNLIAVPLLALAGSWEIAFILVVLERAGKGLRAPARDVIIAEITEPIGKGKGFGIHELLDQIGAIAGPSFIAWSLMTSHGNYRLSLMYLAIPAIIALALVITASILYPKVKSVSVPERGREPLPRKFIMYLVSVSVLSLGFAHWALISYHLRTLAIASDYFIPLFYTLAMLVDAIVAIPIGFLYDKIGLKVFISIPLLTFIASLVLVTNSIYPILLFIIVWGIVMGAYETIMRAAVADLVDPRFRAYAYGIFGLMVGLSWMIGNAIMGFLYQYSRIAIAYFVFSTEILALAFALIGFLRK